MTRVLIPFSDPAGGERAVRALLCEIPDRSLEVHLLAIVEPLTPGKVPIFLSPKRARELATDAAQSWLDWLVPLLTAAGISSRSEVAVGRIREVVRAAAERPGHDRVLMPTRGTGWLSAWRGKRQARHAARPVTVVS